MPNYPWSISITYKSQLKSSSSMECDEREENMKCKVLSSQYCHHIHDMFSLTQFENHIIQRVDKQSCFVCSTINNPTNLAISTQKSGNTLILRTETLHN